MAKTLKIQRQRLHESQSYTQSFLLEEGAESLSVAEALESLNAQEQLRTTEGESAEPVRFEQSCMQKKCGACAMLIQGVPKLACSAKLSDYKEDVIELAPLRKFPTVVDLIVDRSAISENLKTMKVWLNETMEVDDRYLNETYDSARCLMCGCCLEVCPNFMLGDDFYGAAGTMAASRLILSLPVSQRKEFYKEYKTHIYNGCGKSLSCQNICPAEISIENLLTRSNGMAVWNRN